MIGDHAGCGIPQGLGDLGLAPPDLVRHIAWDIGVAALGRSLSQRLDAVFVAQTWSRLVIDCNRDPDATDAVPAISDGTEIPGNVDLTPSDRASRIAEIHLPYQTAIGREIERRSTVGQPTILVSLHSFTPAMKGFQRPWDAGVLHDRGDNRFALSMLNAMRRDPGLVIGDNEPYHMDSIDHTIPRHAYPADLPYVELEIRQDHLGADVGVALWAGRIDRWLREAQAETS
ncbi:N-formylglutamate amidohydrolase [soil metagenome]